MYLGVITRARALWNSLNVAESNTLETALEQLLYAEDTLEGLARDFDDVEEPDVTDNDAVAEFSNIVSDYLAAGRTYVQAVDDYTAIRALYPGAQYSEQLLGSRQSDVKEIGADEGDTLARIVWENAEYKADLTPDTTDDAERARIASGELSSKWTSKGIPGPAGYDKYLETFVKVDDQNRVVDVRLSRTHIYCFSSKLTFSQRVVVKQEIDLDANTWAHDSLWDDTTVRLLKHERRRDYLEAIQALNMAKTCADMPYF